MEERDQLEAIKYVKSHSSSKKKSAILFIRKSTKRNLNFEWEPPKIDEVIYILKKQKKERSHRDIKILSDYLTEKLDYFKKLQKESDPFQYEKTLSVLKYEEVKEGKNIVSYDEDGDKCYILLEGKVSVLKPTYPNTQLSMREYISYLKKLNEEDPSKISLKRIISKNDHIEVDVLRLMNFPLTSINNEDKYNIYIEKLEKIYEAKEGFSFGESALLQRQKRNATVRAENFCRLIYIDKNDYNRILKDIEKRRIDEQIKEFVKKYNFFSGWSYSSLNKLYCLLENVTLLKNEFIYKQNEDSDYIYFCIEGAYEIYSLISFEWEKEFIKYITNSRSNFFLKINPNKRINDLKFIKLIKEAKESAPQSPMLFSPIDSGKFNVGLIPQNDIDEIISNNEKKFSNPYNLFKVNMNDLDSSGILGLEEAIEFKKRYTSIKVKSDIAKIKKIKTIDFFKILINNQKDERNDELMLNYICEKKKLLITLIYRSFNYNRNLQMNKYFEEYKKCYDDKKYSNIKNNYINTLSNSPKEINKNKNIILNKKVQIKNPINLNLFIKSSLYGLSNRKRKNSIKFRAFSSLSKKINIRNSQIKFSSIDKKGKEPPISKLLSFSSLYKSQKNIKLKEDFKSGAINNENTTFSTINNISNLTTNLSKKRKINYKQNLMNDKKQESILLKKIRNNQNNKNIYINTLNDNERLLAINHKKNKKNLYFKCGYFINKHIKLGLGPKISLKKESMFLNNDDYSEDNFESIDSNYSNNKAFSLENDIPKRKRKIFK